VIEGVAVRTMDDDFSFQSGSIGQTINRRGIVSSDACCRRQGQAGGPSGSDAAGFCAGRLGDQGGSSLLHLGDRYEVLRSGIHGGANRRRERRATKPARKSGGIDDRDESQGLDDFAAIFL
jgi:hypothetical protein